MTEQEINELIVLAHMHKAMGDQEGWTPEDQSYRFIELARKATLALSVAQQRIAELEKQVAIRNEQIVAYQEVFERKEVRPT